ncbi:hypothetical protein KDAU_19150 [Dictyobacter aurantiacus]|uniref:Uncharacterized protein n=1 Tax=Dictyobacter aurantiacus TaxID=1936993 RepID=A0A401ZCN0_9CHLR|nr:hypothetical protein KDAU_19150 [Dictyobacter aurantiacus]
MINTGYIEHRKCENTYQPQAMIMRVRHIVIKLDSVWLKFYTVRAVKLVISLCQNEINIVSKERFKRNGRAAG